MLLKPVLPFPDGLIAFAAIARIAAHTHLITSRFDFSVAKLNSVAFPKSQSFSWNANKRPIDDRRARPRFSCVFRPTIFVPRTQTLNDASREVHQNR
jgi:hypothetical protein